jgi:hypothetical protein
LKGRGAGESEGQERRYYILKDRCIEVGEEAGWKIRSGDMIF